MDFELVPPHGAFVVIRNGNETMAGGALRRLSDGVGEIERMWKAPQARGRGYARVPLRPRDGGLQLIYHVIDVGGRGAAADAEVGERGSPPRSR